MQTETQQSQASTVLSGAWWTALTHRERKWVQRLIAPPYGQRHLFAELLGDPPLHPGVPSCRTAEDVKRIINQVDGFEAAYPGGLLGYLEKARHLLQDAREQINPFSGFTPMVPPITRLETGSPEYLQLEQRGLEEIQHTAFVLVAGGLGERLGYPGIKVSLPVDSMTGTSFLELYLHVILACEVHVAQSTGIRPKLPVAIMTSDDTHEKTVTFLKHHGFFGFPREQLYLIKQEKVLAVLDDHARLAFAEVPSSSTQPPQGQTSPPLVLAEKPHGHGDVHTLLNKTGLARQWTERGLKWLFVFQDTNPLAPLALAVLLGVSAQNNLVMNSLAVPRSPGEAVGAICSLRPNTHAKGTAASSLNGGDLTINVEYNRLAALLSASGLGEDVSDPLTGFSRFPGNTNVLVFNLPRYNRILEITKGSIPEFVNPKYANASKTLFKVSTRLECLMQEFPRLLESCDKVGVTELDRWVCFTTVKNNLEEAACKSRKGLPPESAFSAEADVYYAHAKLLELAASSGTTKRLVDIAAPVPTAFAGVSYRMGPKVVLHPSFGFTLTQIKPRFTGSAPLTLGPQASLIIKGDVTISGLEIPRGSLRVLCGPGKTLKISALKVDNRGVQFVELQPHDVKPVDGCHDSLENAETILPSQIRGYRIVCLESTDLCCD